MLRAFAAALLLLLLPAAVAAEASERRMVDDAEAPAFHGVGRLNIAGSRFCTATLVAPDVIVTAAHCLFHPLTGARVRDSELRFVAGYRIDDRVALRRVTRTVIDPDYDFAARATYDGVGADLALARLQRPTPASVAPFATVALDPERPLSIVSYGQDRPHAPSIEAPCGIVEETGAVLALDCAVTYGASGSPLFQDGALVGVVSAMGRLIRPPVDVTFVRLLGAGYESLRESLEVAPTAGTRPLPRP
jgi:protease YdgD